MKGKNYKIVSLYSFFPFQENLIHDLKNKLLEIENEYDLSGLLIFASEGINGTICAEKNIVDIVINLLNKYSGNRNLNIKENFSKYKLDVFEIGKTGGDLIQINNVINISVNETKEAWANGLREKL